jgi:hypothetical protein
MIKRYLSLSILTMLIAGVFMAQSAYAGQEGKVGKTAKQKLQVVAVLTGQEEVPSVQTKTFGSFHMQIMPSYTGSNFSLWVWEGTNVTAAHLHCAPYGKNGPVIATLWSRGKGGKDVNGLLKRRSLSNADIVDTKAGGECPVSIFNLKGLRKAIEDGLIYVNVHSEEYPNGVIRAQLYVGTSMYKHQEGSGSVGYQ